MIDPLLCQVPRSPEEVLARLALVHLGRLFAWARGMRLDPYRPTARDVAPLVRRYYEDLGNCAGGSLHIVLDDNNMDDDSVRFCIENAIDREDLEGLSLGIVLLSLSKTQRIKAGTLR